MRVVAILVLLLIVAPVFARPQKKARHKPAPPPAAPLVVPGPGMLTVGGMSLVTPGSLAGKTIVLDPGHGGSNPGAVAPRGLRESDLNLAVGRELRELLTAAGATVVLTRVGDTDCLIAPAFVLRDDLVARATISNHMGADLFLSLHHNDTPRRMSAKSLARYNRTEIYYRMDDEGPSRAFGAAVFESLFPLLASRRSVLVPGAFAVLRFNERPAVLGEPFYMAAAAYETIAKNPLFASAEAARYLQGIVDYLGRSYPAPRIVRPIDGEVVERESFPLVIQTTTSAGASLLVTVAGRPLEVRLDAAGRGWARLTGVPNGPAVIEATLAQGGRRFGPIARRRFVMSVPPARLELALAPPAADPAYAGPTLVTATVKDARGLPVADGTAVALDVGGTIARGTTRRGVMEMALDGTAHRIPPPWPALASLAAEAGALAGAPAGGATTAAAPLLTVPEPLAPLRDGPRTVSARCAEITSSVATTQAASAVAWIHGKVLDSRSGDPVPDLTARAMGPGVRLAVDRTSGHYLLWSTSPVPAGVELAADGYLPLTSPRLNLTPQGGVHDLFVQPVLAGAFHDRAIVFDAEPGSQTPAFFQAAIETFGGTGMSGLHTTWSGHGTADEQHRAKAANRTPAEIAISINNLISGPLAGPVEISYYHASDRGKAMAGAIADAFRRYFPAVGARTHAGGNFFLNNTRATTLAMSFGNGRRGTPMAHDRVAYVVMHGLMRALRPDVPRGRTITGKAPPGVAPGSWMIMSNGDRCRLDAQGAYTLLDVPSGRHTVWFQAEAPQNRPSNRTSFWIDVP